MEGEPLGNKLALVLAKAVVNKLSDSLAVVIVKKLGYTASYSKAQWLVENVKHRPEEKCQTLDDTLAKVETKVLGETHCEKLKEVELRIPERQLSMCKADAHVEPLPKKLKKAEAQTSLHTLVKVKAKELLVEKEEALAKKLIYTITEVETETLANRLTKVDVEVLNVTEVEMLAEVKVQTLVTL